MKKFILFLLLSMFLFIPQSYARIIEMINPADSVKTTSEIKSREIAGMFKRGLFPKAIKQRVSFSGSIVDIEILEVKVIEEGIEVLARAWGIDGDVIGFGKDGSVEIERFKIYNPPILVEDAINGSIIRDNINFATKEITQRKLREDPIWAILETIAHNVKIVGKLNATVVRNKIGNTTSTFYPAAGAAEPIDGYVYRESYATPMTWSDIRNGAGTHVSATDDSLYVQIIKNGLLYNHLIRNIVCINATAIADTDTIDSVTASVWGVSKSDPGGFLPNSDWYTSTPASTSNLVAADYSQTGTVSQTGSPITYAAFTSGAYNDYTFNATGRGNLSKTAISKFAWKNENYDVADVDSPISGSSCIIRAYSADVAGTSNDVKFVVAHTVASGFIPKITWW